MCMKKNKISILSTLLLLLLASCMPMYSIAYMTSSKMNKLELGMSKEQVTQVLGTDYKIAEKRLEDNNEIEVLSYRDRVEKDEVYYFVFKNKKLEKWYQELIPIERIEIQ